MSRKVRPRFNHDEDGFYVFGPIRPDPMCADCYYRVWYRANERLYESTTCLTRKQFRGQKNQEQVDALLRAKIDNCKRSIRELVEKKP